MPRAAQELPDVPLTQTGRRAALKKGTDDVVNAGQHFTRTVDMWVIPSVVVQAGLEFDPDISAEEQLITFIQRRNFRYWEALNLILPNLVTMLTDTSENARKVKDIYHALLTGNNQARHSDTQSIKSAIISAWLLDELAAARVLIPPKNKARRGFNNDVTGRYLCPMVLDYKDPAVRKALAEHTAEIDGNPVNGSHWPVFVYDEDRYNPARTWETFLRGRLIIMSVKHIFTSPSSATSETNEGRGTRAGNAGINGMVKMTPGAIIYAATHVHFALCSVDAFRKDVLTLDTHVFHRALVEFFERPSMVSVVADLLSWWDSVIFPQYSTPHTGENYGLAQMEAQFLAAQQPPATSTA